MPKSVGDLHVDVVLGQLKALLKPLGFTKKGPTFHRPVGDVIHVIQVQRDKNSTADAVAVTVNVAVYVPALAKAEGDPVSSSPAEYGCHWRERLGLLMPGRRDRWWQLGSEAGAKAAAAEIARAVESAALPKLAARDSTKRLLLSWRNGDYSGLTGGDALAARFIEMLKRR